MSRRWARMMSAGVVPQRVIREPRATESVPLKSALVLVLVISACVFVGLWADGHDVRLAGLWAVIVCGLLCAVCLAGDLLAAHRTATVEEYAPRALAQGEPVRLQPIPFSARDAREFMHDALIRVNGEWKDKGGGMALRPMMAKGWTRTRWELATRYLLKAGVLRWKDEAEPQQGYRWDWGMVEKWMEG